MDLMQKKFNKINVAFIGGGISSVVGYSHKVAIEMDGRFRLVAGCFSKKQSINEKTAKDWMLENCNLYDNWCELMERERDSVDVIIVLTPTNQHTDIIISAIKHGYFVVSEKALCSSVEDAQNIKRVIDDNNGYLAVTYNYSGYPMFRELQEIINSGKLGKVLNINAEMPQEGFVKLNKQTNNVPDPQNWRMSDTTIPTISLDLGVHVHQLIKALISQKPLSVVAIQNSFGKVKSVIDDVNCLIKYDGGSTANIWYSKSALGYKNGLRLRVFGSKGSAEWLQTNSEYLSLTDTYGHSISIDRSNQDLLVANQNRYNRFKPGHPSGFLEAFANYYDDIYEEIISIKKNEFTKERYVYGIDTAIEGLKLLQSISISSKTLQWESMSSNS